MNISNFIAEITNLIPGLLSTLGLVIAAYTMHKSSSFLRYRLQIERKLAHNLALELKKRHIESQVSCELNRLEIRGSLDSDKDIQEIESEIHSAIMSAIQQLVEEEQLLIKESLEQPSKQGQFHYIRKLLNNSLQELSHQKA